MLPFVKGMISQKMKRNWYVIFPQTLDHVLFPIIKRQLLAILQDSLSGKS